LSIDLRFRVDGHEPRPSDPAGFFEIDLPAAFERTAESMADAVAWLDLVPLTIEIEDQAWNLSADGTVEVASGPATRGGAVRLTPEQLADLAADQASFMGFFTHGTLDQTAGRLEDLLDWWLVLRSALDQRPVHTSDGLSFTAADGRPLDLSRSFRSQDDPAEMQHFLEEAGFLHLKGVFTADEMDAVSRDMDRLAGSYAPDDGQSWWATTADGTQRLVRMQGFETRSDTTGALLGDERFSAIGALPGDGHVFADYAQALVKPIGVVDGISDVPWHKDCSLGRHSYDCCSMTVGISVTGADATSGQLRVVGGSHRVLVWPTFTGTATGLPEVDLPTATGDVTVHLSCTKHMSQPPVDRERRVLYTGFRLPPSDPEAVAVARKNLYRIMECVPEGVSQRPALPGGGV
jgi:hypothetical protein